MIAGYPVVLKLAGRRCVVVGGGQVAARKVTALVRAAADVLVVAPDAAPDIDTLAETGGLRLERRAFEPADLDGAFLVIAATDRREVNRAVEEAARARGALLNVVDDPDACDFTVPALVRRRDVTLAISTGGRSPAFARYLREQLGEWLTDGRCTLLEILAELRRDLRRAGRQVEPEVWRSAIADDEVIRSLESGDREGARRRLFEALMPGR
jgi:precorrin-2 dehydrogenase/sirohydrochlorin ferrochelatase